MSDEDPNYYPSILHDNAIYQKHSHNCLAGEKNYDRIILAQKMLQVLEDVNI